MRFHLLLVVLLVGSVRADDAPPRLRAGAFAMNITPTKFPISVNGNMQDVLATTAHDPLHARCLVLDDGKTKIALVVCDSCMIPRELLDAAKQRASKATGIPTSHMLVSATHAHSAPTVAGVFQSEPDSDYVAFLTEKIAAGIVKAHANLAQAQVGWAVGKDATQVFNRRWHLKPGSLNKDPFDGTTDKVRMNPGYRNADVDRPAGPVDPDVTVLSVRTPQGRPLALLGNYSLHYVGGVPALSADYFGAFADRIQGLLDVPRGEPPFVGILSNGTSGDVNNVDFSGPPPGARKPGERVRLVADSVARAAHEAYRGIKHGDATLSMAEKEIELGVRLDRKSVV